MIYSKWRPDRGGYDYFANSERRGLGDDLPTPRLTPVGPIGVPSTSAGRPMPAAVRRVGSGPIARGVIAPLDRRGLALSGLEKLPEPMIMFALLSFGGIVGFMLCDKYQCR